MVVGVQRHNRTVSLAPIRMYQTRRRLPFGHPPLSHIPPTRIPKGRKSFNETSSCVLTYLHVTRPPVKIQVKVLDLAEICKFIGDIFFSCLLMNIGNENYPSFDR